MSSRFVTVLIPVGISAFCWWMVISSSSRNKLSKSGADFWRLKKNGQESWDAGMLAGYLVGAIFFSIASITMLLVMLKGD